MPVSHKGPNAPRSCGAWLGPVHQDRRQSVQDFSFRWVLPTMSAGARRPGLRRYTLMVYVAAICKSGGSQSERHSSLLPRKLATSEQRRHQKRQCTEGPSILTITLFGTAAPDLGLRRVRRWMAKPSRVLEFSEVESAFFKVVRAAGSCRSVVNAHNQVAPPCSTSFGFVKIARRFHLGNDAPAAPHGRRRGLAFQPVGSPSTNTARSFVSRERNRREQVSKALRIAGDRSFILSTTQMPVHAHGLL